MDWQQNLLAGQAAVVLKGDRAVVVLGDQGGEEAEATALNRLGATRRCRFGGSSEIRAINLQTGRVEIQNVLMGIYLSSIAIDGMGRIVVGGSERQACWETEVAFIGEVRPDLSVRPVFFDRTGLKTQIDHVVSFEGGTAVVVGHAWESLMGVTA